MQLTRLSGTDRAGFPIEMGFVPTDEIDSVTTHIVDNLVIELHSQSAG